MKKLSIISLVVVAAGTIIGCSDVKRNPGRTYMPDMAYSRAYETYAPHSNLADSGINYNNMPVAGTMKRGELFPFPIAIDKPGDSVNYVAAKQVMNPLPALDANQLKEAERIYLINCGICHGTKLDGDGPLYKGGDGPYPAKPATLVGDIKYETMPEGQMFYSVTYGKNMMGPYASQLTTTQRWMVIHYIKEKQAAGKKAAPATATKDSTATAKK
jgi:mono/diheme cytochrome c family protein